MNRVRGEGGRFNSNMNGSLSHEDDGMIRIKQEKSIDLDTAQQLIMDVSSNLL